MDITGTIAIILTFATAFGIVYIIYSTRHRERMRMIERGMSPATAKPAPDPRKTLRDGLLILGIGLGLLAGWLFREHLMAPMDDERSAVPLLVGAAIFGGLAQVLYYLKFAGSRPQ